MKTVLWIDDLRNPPNRPNEQYLIARSVNEAKALIEMSEKDGWTCPIDYIDIDHDAGAYAAAGGDFINVLNYLEAREGKIYPIHIHTMNAVGYVNMRAICEHNNWTIIPN